MAEAAALHSSRVAQDREDRLEADLENLTVGQIVFERRQDDDDSDMPRPDSDMPRPASKGGVVVDIRLEPRNGAPPYVVAVAITNRAVSAGPTRWEATWHLIDIAGIGEVQLSTGQGKLNRCRDLLSVIGSRRGEWKEQDEKLLRWALTLRDEARQ